MPFRNPVGHPLRESLTTLVRESCSGDGWKARIAPALDALVRLRAVQDFRPSDALRFIFDLRGLIAEVLARFRTAVESRHRRIVLAWPSISTWPAANRSPVCAQKELRFRMQYAAR